MYTCGLLTISDSCYYEKADNISGNILLQEVQSLNNFIVKLTNIVPDEIDKIEECLKNWVDIENVNIILTTGGTGFTPRDVTPEATMRIIDRNAPSISQVLLMKSLEITKFAILSRGVSGIRRSTLIINLPGSPKAVKEYMNYLASVLPHALDQLANKSQIVKRFHLQMTNTLLTKISTMANDVSDRSRNSLFPLFSVEEANKIIISNCKLLDPVMVDIMDSLNMVTANIVKSRVNVPPFRASIKDGYAVKFMDGMGKRNVVSVSNAGDKNDFSVLVSGTCVRISTGAKVPEGADSVVQVEDTQLCLKDVDNGEERVIEIKVAPTEIGQDIRPIGNDLLVEDLILESGKIIGPTEIGLLAMGGVDKVECIRQPVIGVLSTGNELVDYNKNYDNLDRIIDCNRPLLISLFQSFNFKVVDLGIVQDEPQTILDRLIKAFQSCDVLVTTGGVSMGEKDFLKSVLCEDLNAEIHFGRIFMKPGKPMTFSTICNQFTNNQTKLIFSLPGNPVSAFVTSHLFVIPALKKLGGISEINPLIIEAQLQHNIKLDIRPEYRRCRIISKRISNGSLLEVSSQEFGNQMSSRLASCVAADGLIILPPSTEFCKILDLGSTVSVMKF